MKQIHGKKNLTWHCNIVQEDLHLTPSYWLVLYVGLGFRHQ